MDLPKATTRIVEAGGTSTGSSKVIGILAPVARDADYKPRIFSSIAALLAKHSYAQGVDYSALHVGETGLSVFFVPLPIVTAGTIFQVDTSGVEGSSVVTVAAGDDGVLEEVDAEIIVTKGGTIGADSIVLDVSMDGGRTFKPVRLGTADEYTVPYLGIVVSFAAGDVDVDDTITFKTTAPRADQAGIAQGRAKLAEALQPLRTWLLVGDLQEADDATDLVTEANAYETENERFVRARAQVYDRPRDAKMVGGPTLTFAEVGATGDTITRSAGSFIADGFRVGMEITVTGAVNSANNITSAPIASLTATVITLGTTDLVAEAATADATMTGTVDATDWSTEIIEEFEGIANEKRIDLGAGRGRKLSPITGWRFRRPAAWGASIREYQHTENVPTWRKDLGPLSGWDLRDEDGNLVEHDDRITDNLLRAGFTCFRTWGNGPRGTFIAGSVTRAEGGSVLSLSHNMDVANVACTVVQAEGELTIGVDLILEDDDSGHATEVSIGFVEDRINSALQMALLENKGEGPLASSATWTASRDDVLNVVDATLTGELKLVLNGTIAKVNTSVRVQSGAAAAA